MKRFFIFFVLICTIFTSVAQSKHKQPSESKTQAPTGITDSLQLKNVAEKESSNRNLIQAADTLTMSDYVISIERVNSNINDIRDSIKLGFEMVHYERQINKITENIALIRQNIRDRHSVVNEKSLYLYQSFANKLDKENTKIQTLINNMYTRVYHARTKLKTTLSDSVFNRLYTNSNLRKTFNKKVIRLERKWARTDSTSKANIDTLNAFKVKLADNSMSISSALNIMDNRLDKAGQQIFGQEVNYLWQSSKTKSISNDKLKADTNLLENEQKALGYYLSQTLSERTFILILGIILFTWLFLKRNLLKTLKEQKKLFDFLHLQYLNSHPVLSLLILLLCLTPFFDAYAPISYIAIEYILLLVASSIIFLKKRELPFQFNWFMLAILFIADTLTYLFVEPTLVGRLWLLTMHVAILIFSLRFYKNLNKEMSYYKWIKKAVIAGIFLTGLGILCNIFGRFSLAGTLGLASIFAITQAIILPVFIDIIIEIFLLQLHSSRLKKGINKPFDTFVVVKRIKGLLFFIAVLLWAIMLTSSLNIYHGISNGLIDMLTSTRTIGNISFRLISILWFFMIIWFAHILQRLISFLFGETGVETEDLTAVSKGHHSRLLITRLLVLIGGYLLAIVASGLPIDKLTIVLGALGVGIGMGLQNVVNNFVSGIILIFDGSLKIGDEIEVSGQTGKVKEIGLRACTVSTSDGAEVIIPNGNLLSQNIVNWTFSNNEKRVMIQFSLSGKEMDTNMVNELINETIKNIPDVISAKRPIIVYTKVTHKTHSLIVRFWSTTGKADMVKSEAMLRLNSAFSDKNIGFK